MMPASTAGTPCPCGLARAYPDCCGRWHAGPLHLQAPDAQALMRSRYSAFALWLPGYLLDTWHPSTRPAALEPPPDGLRWLGLDVRRYLPQDADHALVEFVARSKLGGRAQRLHETSRFVREQQRWFYLDGDLRSPSSCSRARVAARCACSRPRSSG
jgi:SEC-C motif-containing protein